MTSNYQKTLFRWPQSESVGDFTILRMVIRSQILTLTLSFISNPNPNP